MADTKISGLAAAAAFLTTHELPVNEAGTSKKVTGAQILAKAAQGSGGSAWYAQVTANQVGAPSPGDLTGLTVTVTGLASRRFRVSWQVACGSSVATDSVAVTCTEDATVIQTCNLASVIGGGLASTMPGMVIITAGGAGAHTYKLTMTRSAGSGNVTMFASATQPAFILIEDIGT